MKTEEKEKRKAQLKYFEKEHKERQASKLKQFYCKNTTVTVEETTLGKENYKLVKGGCANERRHCSAYCGKCSDKHQKTVLK